MTENILQLAPSFGFFGEEKKLSLKVGVELFVDALRIKVNKASKEILNLKGLVLFDEKLAPISSEIEKKITCSSSWANRDENNLFYSKGFHSNKEFQPWWMVEFSQATYVSCLEVLNRGDFWGNRSQFISVEVKTESGQWVNVYESTGLARIEYFYEQSKKLLDLDLKAFVFESESDSRSKVIIPKIFEKLKEKEYNSEDEIMFLMQFLPIWQRQFKVTDNDIKLLAFFIFTLKGLGFSLKQFANILSSKGRIEKFESEVNKLRSQSGLDEIMLTKHGLARKGKLLKNKEKTLLTLVNVMSELEKMGLEPMLAYGTLLGAYRDDGFMEHDDDVDILIKLSSTSQNEVAKEMYLVSCAFESKGYHIGAINNHFNRHFVDKKTKVAIDVFPCWLENGRYQLHMEKMKIRDIEASVFSKRNTLKLYGEVFPIPGKTEEFLLERYGYNWCNKDPYHEWPWALED